MAGYLTNYGLARALKAGLGQSVAAAAGMYLGLTTILPDTSEPGGEGQATLAQWNENEPNMDGYARQAVTWGDPGSSPVGIANAATISFGPFLDDLPEIAYCFLCDAESGTTGNVLAYWSLTTARDVGVGDSLQCVAGQLSLMFGV
jgi:hypothetical protein